MLFMTRTERVPPHGVYFMRFFPPLPDLLLRNRLKAPPRGERFSGVLQGPLRPRANVLRAVYFFFRICYNLGIAKGGFYGPKKK